MRTFLIKRGGLGLLVIGILLVSVSITYAGAGLLADIIGQSDKTIKLEPLASGLTAPNFGTSAPGDESRLFVSDQDGILWAIDLEIGRAHV